MIAVAQNITERRYVTSDLLRECVCVFVCLPFCVFRTALVFYIWQAAGGRALCVFR